MDNDDVFPADLLKQGESRAASQYLSRFSWLQYFTEEELQRISFCEVGVGLQPGETYFDFSHPESDLINVRTYGEVSPPGTCYVARGSVSDETWHRLMQARQEAKQ